MKSFNHHTIVKTVEALVLLTGINSFRFVVTHGAASVLNQIDYTTEDVDISVDDITWGELKKYFQESTPGVRISLPGVEIHRLANLEQPLTIHGIDGVATLDLKSLEVQYTKILETEGRSEAKLVQDARRLKAIRARLHI